MTNEDVAAFVKKNPVSMGCAALILALGLVIYFRGDAQGEAETLLAEKTATGERHAANIKYSAQLDEHFNEITAANKEIDSRLVRINQLGVNSQFFYKLEGDSGVKLIDFRQNTQVATKGKTTFTPVAFSVSAQGNLAQVMHFLRRLESGARYGRVLTASITTNSANRQAPLTLTLNLELLGTP